MKTNFKKSILSDDQQVINAILQEQYKLSSDCQFMPTRYKPGETIQINWNATLSGNNTSCSFNYHQGIAHVHNYNLIPYHLHNKIIIYDAMRQTALTGISYIRDVIPGRSAPCPFVAVIPPLVDLVWCMTMDCDVINYRDFDDWAECFGYDADSREAERIYAQCKSTAKEFLLLLGDSLGEQLQVFEQLQELFQDY